MLAMIRGAARRFKTVVSLAFAATLFARSGAAQTRATSAISDCETRSQRTDEEILAPFADERTPALPRIAVTIEAGEELCLTGNVRDDGKIADLALVRDGTQKPLIALRLSRRERYTLLAVEHASERWLGYHAARVITQLDLAVPTQVLPVRHGLVNYESWGDVPERLVLFGFQLFTPPPPPAPPVRRFAGPEGKGLFIGITAFTGLAEARFTGLSDALARDGFETLSTTHFFAGLGVEGRFGPVRVALPLELGWLSSAHRDTKEEIDVRIFNAGLYLGWDFWRAPGHATFFGASFQAGSVNVTAASPSFTLFRDRLAAHGDVEEVIRAHGRVVPELGHDRYIKLANLPTNEHGALQIGGRIGYAWQFSAGDWEIVDEKGGTLGGGPHVDTSGPRFRLILGLLVD